MSQGIFISLDGLDGTGKSTQCDLLAQWLRDLGHAVTQCVDPGGSKIGRQIRNLLLDNRQQMTLLCEMFLFMASRAQLTDEIIRPALQGGHIIISDRFLLANVVYQGHAGGLSPEDLWNIGKIATGGLLPNLTLVLDVPLEIATQRRKEIADRMESRSLQFHERVRQGFLKEAELHPTKIQVVDASEDVNLVQKKLREKIKQIL